NSTFQIASLAVDGQSQALFEVSALANTPLETVAPVVLSAESGAYQASKNSQIIIGYIPEYIMNSDAVTACIGRFYDSGGSNGAYSNNENITKTFYPATTGAKLMFNFTSFDVENSYEKLYVYDGPNASSPQIQGSPFTGTNSPGTFMATNAEGAITFKFTSDGMVTKPGWSASFYCVDLSVPPASATNPFPANGSVVTTSPVNFTWSFVPGATSYDIYFGPNSLPETPTANVTTNAWTNTVAPFSNYVWKVVPKNNAGQATDCETWSFSTQAISTTILMQNGQFTTCDAIFHDSGGENGQYGNNENFVLTVYPSNNYSKIKLDFLSFDTENNYDKLYIYDGTTVSAPQMQGSPFTGTNSPGTKVATNAQGALTIKFTSDASVVANGWKAIVSCQAIAGSQAVSTDFTFVSDVVLNTIISPVVNNNATITVWVNGSANISSLTPIMTLSDGATVNPPMGSPIDFTNPVTFSVTSQNGLVVNQYQVTVISVYIVTFFVSYDGIPVEGAVITIDNQQINTDANGLASINLTGGTYSYTVSKTGYNTITGEVVVSSDIQITINLTGIGGTIVENTCLVYPNPFKHELVFDRISNVAQIKIFDATGRNVQTISNNGGSQLRISTETLSSGVYFIGFTLGDGSQTIIKIIKQ
ncbi:MAG TPA: T9SS type A sorting domain-containing protein, partial [Salinivirgaceae bacterium]|nr:T9SS type A sorting domain-containing protein [Salinivirgaceae bacterium]